MSAVAVSAMFRAHPEQPSHVDAIGTCIDACSACVETCTACADACLAEKDMERLITCIRLNQDCAAVCAATGSIMSRANKVGHRQLLEAQLTTCIAFCRACAAECRRHAQTAQALRSLRQGLHALRDRLHRDAVVAAAADLSALQFAQERGRARPRSSPASACASARRHAGPAAADRQCRAAASKRAAKSPRVSIRSRPITVSPISGGTVGRAAVCDVKQFETRRQTSPADDRRRLSAVCIGRVRRRRAELDAHHRNCLHPASIAACRKRSRPKAVRNSPCVGRSRHAARATARRCAGCARPANAAR